MLGTGEKTGEEEGMDGQLALKKLEVLVIEDSSTMRNFIRRSLEKAFPGLSVSEADDGRAALQQLGRMRASLIICDLQMPRMDGHSFLKTLRANPVLRHKPVILFSSENPDTLDPSLRADPKLRFLAKPAEAAALADAAREFLEQA